MRILFIIPLVLMSLVSFPSSSVFAKDTLQISEDSLRCSYSWNERTKEFTTAIPKFYVFDGKFKTITFHYPSINMKKAYECQFVE